MVIAINKKLGQFGANFDIIHYNIIDHSQKTHDSCMMYCELREWFNIYVLRGASVQLDLVLIHKTL